MQIIDYLHIGALHIEKDTMIAPIKNMHYHSTMEIYYLISGEREYFIDDKLYKLEPGDLIFIPEGVIHRTDGRGAMRILMYIGEDYLKKHFSDAVLKSLYGLTSPIVVRPSIEERHRLASLTHSAHNLFESDRENAELNGDIACKIFEILYYLSNDSKKDELMPSSENENLTSIISYINTNYANINSLSDISKRFYLNSSYFCRLFSQSLGMPFTTYLNMVRIKNACDMLTKGDDSVTEVARKCGYTSQSYFCKAFKKKMGISPLRYMKSMK